MSVSEALRAIVSNHWPFLAEATFEPTQQGSSQTTYFVYTSDHRFILKLYGATTKTAQIEYEHSLLTFLQSTNFPFAIPVPISATNGKTFAAVEADSQFAKGKFVLLPRLVGQTMDRQNLDQVQSAGFTLGKLHHHLARFDPEGYLARLPFWGMLDQIHPLVSDPLNVPQILSLGLEEQQQLGQLLRETIEAAPHLYATLPIQTIHADYITPNILVEDDRVVGILDFEFATRDLRLFDYLSSLDQFASFPWQNDRFEETVRAFSMGYQACSSLTVAELNAAITVWKLQRASSLVYWTGWLLEKQGDRQQLVNSVMDTLRFETWLETNQQRLLEALGIL